MDSFYDVPRRAPAPTQIDKFIVGPTVPEVSMICLPRAAQNNLPYGAWKKSTTRNMLSNGSDGIKRIISPQNTSTSLKKQVTFGSPVGKQTDMAHENIIPTSTVKNLNMTNPIQRLKCQLNVNEKDVPGVKSDNNTFKRMYMANIPHRELDLSIIDLPQHQIDNRHPSQTSGSDMTRKIFRGVDENKENIEASLKPIAQSYREFLDGQCKQNEKRDMLPMEIINVAKKSATVTDDSIADVFNFRKENVDIENKFLTSTSPKSPVLQSRENDIAFGVRISERSRPVFSNTQTGIPCDNRFSSSNASNFSVPQNRHIGARYNSDDYRYHLSDSSKHITGCSNDVPNSNMIERYKMQEWVSASPQRFDGETQTTCSRLAHDDNKHVASNDQEPTNRDLLKIIAQQNEQLLILQKQVAMLLNHDKQSRPIEAPPRQAEKLVSSTHNEYYRPEGTPKKRGMSKFSIGLMTSFEVAVRPQASKQNFINMEPKIQEITESESIPISSPTLEKEERDVEASLHFQQQVRESIPSPEPSINIDMQDFDSSYEETTVSDIGATFYWNLMGQVNHILKKAHLQTQDEFAARDQAQYERAPGKNDRKISRVKEAMVKHLKSIGVKMDDLNDSEGSNSCANDSTDYTPTEISFAVKQLLMKYLPDDQLAKVAKKQAPAPLFANQQPATTVGRPEFSFASVQYMKKYNLLPPNNLKVPRQEKQKVTQGHVENKKILDMTALKMQPKLL